MRSEPRTGPESASCERTANRSIYLIETGRANLSQGVTCDRIRNRDPLTSMMKIGRPRLRAGFKSPAPEYPIFTPIVDRNC